MTELTRRAWNGDGYYDSDERPPVDRRDHPQRMYPFAERACPPVRMLSRPRRFCDNGNPNANYEREMARWRREHG